MTMLLISDTELMALHRFTRVAINYLFDEYHINKNRPNYKRIDELNELNMVRNLCDKIEGVPGFSEAYDDIYKLYK